MLRLKPECSFAQLIGGLLALAMVLTFAGGAWANPPPTQPRENAAESTMVIVRASWASLRATPGPKGKAIGIVFGNDAFPMLDRRKGWVRIRLGDHRVAWLSDKALADAPLPPPATIAEAQVASLPDVERTGVEGAGATKGRLQMPQPPPSPSRQKIERARGLQATGRRNEARELYLDILLRDPGTTAFYQAMRGMNFYYPLGEFPKVHNDRVPPQEMALAEAKLGELFIREGEARLGEQRPLDAAASFEWALLHGGVMWDRATSGLREALTAYLTSRMELQPAQAMTQNLTQTMPPAAESMNGPDSEQVRRLAREMWKDYFPREPVPGSDALAVNSDEGSRKEASARP